MSYNKASNKSGYNEETMEKYKILCELVLKEQFGVKITKEDED